MLEKTGKITKFFIRNHILLKNEYIYDMMGTTFL